MENSKTLGKTVSGINTYIQQYLPEPFITVSRRTLEDQIRRKVDDWLYSYISRSIFYDLNRHHKNSLKNTGLIKNTLKTANISEESLLTPDIKNSLYSDLVIFFEEESEIFIDTRSEIEMLSRILAEL